MLRPFGKQGRQTSHQTLLTQLQQLGDGQVLPVTDKSSPQLILSLTGLSKGAFKKALGQLYKQRLVEIRKDGVASAPDRRGSSARTNQSQVTQVKSTE